MTGISSFGATMRLLTSASYDQGGCLQEYWVN